jgi:hypothetical protein
MNRSQDASSDLRRGFTGKGQKGPRSGFNFEVRQQVAIVSKSLKVRWLPPNKRCSGPVLLSSWVQIASLRSAAPKTPVPSLRSGRTGR